jgi:DNA polymerase I-like protein with 3'-5' exonuclease and polymerase domains
VIRELYDYPMQHCATIIKDRAMVELDRWNAPLWLDHHDALYLEVPTGDLEGWANRQRKVMESPIPELDGMVFPVDMEVGPTWGTMTPLAA